MPVQLVAVCPQMLDPSASQPLTAATFILVHNICTVVSDLPPPPAVSHLIHQLVVGWACDTRLVQAKVERVIAQRLIVGANVKDAWQHLGRVEAWNTRQNGKLAAECD